MSEPSATREQEIRDLAYQLWQEAGQPEGQEDEFWRMAETRLGKTVPNDDLDVAGAHSFPASDPVNHT